MLARQFFGVSDYGVIYEMQGTRGSGDPHTSKDNGKINGFNTYVATRHLHPSDVVDFEEGDDGLCGIRGNNIDRALDGFQLIGAMGFDLKLDHYHDIWQTSFCGRHHYVEDGALKQHADIWRSLDKFHTTVSNCREDSVITAKALSYHHTDADTPLLGPLSYAIATVLRPKVSFSALKRANHSYSKERWMVDSGKITRELKPPNITAAARASCYLRTGLSVEVQLAFESVCYKMIQDGVLYAIPPLEREWAIREDGYVFGDPSTWVR